EARCSARAVPLADGRDRVHAITIVPHVVVGAALPLEGAMLVTIAAVHTVGFARVRLALRPIRVVERFARHPGERTDARLLRHLAVLRADPMLVAVKAPREIVLGNARERDEVCLQVFAVRLRVRKSALFAVDQVAMLRLGQEHRVSREGRALRRARRAGTRLIASARHPAITLAVTALAAGERAASAAAATSRGSGDTRATNVGFAAAAAAPSLRARAACDEASASGTGGRAGRRITAKQVGIGSAATAQAEE